MKLFIHLSRLRENLKNFFRNLLHARIFIAEERERESYHFTIGRKIAFAFLILLILMAAIIGITLQVYNSVIKNLEETTEEASKQGAAGNVRFSIAQLIMYANDYIITEKDNYRYLFEQQRARVENYKKKLREFELSSYELAIADSIAADLDSIYVYANQIFAIPSPRSSPEATALMEIMDYTFGNAVNRKTTEFFDIVFRTIEEQRIQSALAKEQMLNIIYTVFFLGFLVSLVVAYLSVKKIAKPIAMVAKAANSIANGDYSQRPMVSTRDEVGLLARSFSQMAEAIEGTHQNLEARKRFTENIVATVPSGLLVIGKESEVLSVNRSFCELFNVTRLQVVGKTVDAALQTIGLSQKCRDAIAVRMPFRNLECTCSIPGKGELTLNLTLSGIRVAEEEEEEEELLVIEDITERKRAEETLKKLSSAVEQTADIVFITDRDGIIEYVNPAFEKFTGYTKQEAIGKTPRILKSGSQSQAQYELLWRTILSGRVYSYVPINKKKSGELFYSEQTITPIKDTHGSITHFVSTNRDITERKRAEEELIIAKELAEQSNKLKDAFIANMSHEIRTPLNGILGMTSLIKDIYAQHIKEEDEELFYGIDDSSKRIIRTVDMILNYSRLQTGELPVSPEAIELSSICERLVREFQTAAKSESLELLFENRCKDSTILADEYSVTQSISNLIDNAIKYTKKGFVKVILYKNGSDEIMLDVKDSGIGMTKEYIDHIFEPYRQEEMGYGRAYEGVGLGLSLVKKFMDLNNAVISVESKKGEGTTFTVNFGKIVQFVKEKTGSEKIANVVETQETKKDRLVLLVEDDSINQETIKRFIENSYNTLITDSSDEAIEILRKNKIDIILMDISIKGSRNGLELTKELKASKEYSHIAVIAVTAHAFDQDKQNALEAGCDDYISKPFTKESLLDMIAKFV